jgi:hypothetical protein
MDSECAPPQFDGGKLQTADETENGIKIAEDNDSTVIL